MAQLNDLLVLGDSSLLGEAKIFGTLVPGLTEEILLGTSDLKWKAVHAKEFIGTASNALTSDKLGVIDVGSVNQPIYLVKGVATAANTYAGGTAVTLNGTSKAATTASFYAPTSAGTEGYLLIADKDGNPTWTQTLSALNGGTGINVNPSMLVNLGSTTADSVFKQSPRPGITGTLGVANGGTGQTSAVNAANAFLNALSTSSSVPEDNDFFISQYVNGGTTTTTFHRRPVKHLYTYMETKFDERYIQKGSGNSDFVNVSGDTMTGTLILSKTQDAAATSASTQPALIVGGLQNAQHLEIDGNEILSKSNGTTAATLYLNNEGGLVQVGNGGLTTSGKLTADSLDITNTTGVSHIKFARSGGFSYLHSPFDTSGTGIALCVGATLSAAGSALVVKKSGIEPGSDNTMVSGTSSARWKNVHAVKFTGALEGNASSASYATTAGSVQWTGVTGIPDLVMRREGGGEVYTALGSTYNGGDSNKKYCVITLPDTQNGVWAMYTIELLVKQQYDESYGGKIIIDVYHDNVSTNPWRKPKAFVDGNLSTSIQVYVGEQKYIYITGLKSYSTVAINKMIVGDSARTCDLSSTSMSWVSTLPPEGEDWDCQAAAMSYGLTSGNYASYTVKKDGTGATGTWSIGITGASRYLETWKSDMSGTYGASYRLYPKWISSDVCQLLVDNYTVKVDQSTRAFNADNGIYYVEGNTTGTAGTWTGTNTNIPELVAGVTIAYKIGIAGASAGTTLNLTTKAGASGAKPVKRNTSTFTTHIGVGGIVHLTYDGSNWVWDDYDSSDRKVRQYSTTASKAYPLLMRYTDTTSSDTYISEYTRYSQAVTLNPSTGVLTATTFKGTLDGKATSAGTADVATSANSVAWGNVTGKPSSYTPSSHEHSYIIHTDSRGEDLTPINTPKGLSVHLKGSNTDGIAGGANYHAVLNVRSWTDYSGGPWFQMTATENNGLQYRLSKDKDTWDSWRTVALKETDNTFSGKNTFTSGLTVSGRTTGSNDDAGIVVGYATNGYAGLILGTPNGTRSIFYFKNDGTKPWWRYNDGTASYDIAHPGKSGTIAVISDLTWDNITGKPASLYTLPARLAEYQATGNADANNVTQSGFYYMSTTSAGGGNRPPFENTTNDYRILATGYSSSWAQQIATNFRSNEIYFRRLEQGSWKSWVRMMTEEGGTFTGAIKAHGGIKLNSTTAQASGAPQYILGIKAFADGGDVIWQNIANVSVGYATSAGSAASATNAGYATSAGEAPLLSISHSSKKTTSTKKVSTWDGGKSSEIKSYVWGQGWMDSTNTGNSDSGDLVLGLRQGVYTTSSTELCMMIDGDYYSMGYKVAHANNSSYSWTGGTTAGPQLSLSLGGTALTASAIPSASSSASGVVTTAAQTFGGAKTFTGTVKSTATCGFFSEVAAGSWAYMRLQSGTKFWDVATNTSQNDASLQLRPQGADAGKFDIAQNGNVSVGGTTVAINNKVSLVYVAATESLDFIFN